MAFANGRYGKVWEVKPISETRTQIRMSTSRKDKRTDQYETDFSGFVMFVGRDNAAKALKLATGDRIQLGDVEVTTKYDKEKKITYTNFVAFSFEMSEGGGAPKPAPKAVDDGEPDDSNLPW